MTHDNRSGRSLLSLFGWTGLVVLAFALLGLGLTGSRLVEASVPAQVLLPPPSPSLISPTEPSTIYLPLLAHDYPCNPVEGVNITGPAVGTVGVRQSFTAEVSPEIARQPITYTWQASGQEPIVHTGRGLSDGAGFTWDLADTQFITVEAANKCGEPVSDTYPLTTAYRNYIAFERDMPGGHHDIFIMYQNGTRLENITNSPNADDGTPTWSPDGNYIAFTSRPDDGEASPRILKIDLRTRVVTQLTDGSDRDRWPTWSPDGTLIAFQRKVTNPPSDKEIYVMDPNGNNQQNLTDSDYSDEYPSWSWDGEWIAFISERFDFQGRDLWIVDPDNPGDQRSVQRTDNLEELYPTWSPDGRIYYTFSPTEKAELLYRIWPDGSGKQQVFNDDYSRYIASFAPDGQCFVFYGFMGGPDKEIWKWCTGFTTPINLTNNAGISDEFCAWSPVP